MDEEKETSGDATGQTANGDSPGPAICGYPTQAGGPCRNAPLGGPNRRCFRHSGIPTTKAEQEASRQNATKHGYFVSGFLDKEERARFEDFLAGGLEPEDLRQRMVAALILRAERMMRWEDSGERGERVSGYTTDAFAELRQSLEGLPVEAAEKQEVMDDVELLQRVEVLLRADRELLLRQLPPEVQAPARAAWAELDRRGQAEDQGAAVAAGGA